MEALTSGDKLCLNQPHAAIEKMIIDCVVPQIVQALESKSPLAMTFEFEGDWGDKLYGDWCKVSFRTNAGSECPGIPKSP